MCSNTIGEIDALALAVEHAIAQNKVDLAEHEETYMSFSEFRPSPALGMDVPDDTMELFS